MIAHAHIHELLLALRDGGIILAITMGPVALVGFLTRKHAR